MDVAFQTAKDVSHFSAFLGVAARQFWESQYWAQSPSIPDESYGDLRLRSLLSEIIARMEVKSIVGEIYDEIDDIDIPLDVHRSRLLRSFHIISPQEEVIEWGEVEGRLRRLFSVSGAPAAFKFPFLEEALGFPVDIFTKDVSVIMGRTGRGKTTLSVNITKEFLDEGYTVCYVSTEMTGEAILSKLVSCVTGKEWRLLYGRGADPIIAQEALEEFANYRKEVMGNLLIYHKARCTVSDIAAASAHAKSCYGKVDLIIVDYIQQVEGDSAPRLKEETRALELATIVGELAQLGVMHNAAVIVVSQVNSQGEVKDARAIEERAGLAVRLGMLSDKEFAAEMLRRLKLEEKELTPKLQDLIYAKFKEVMDIQVKKNRYGAYETRKRYLKFDPARCRILGAWTEPEIEEWLSVLIKAVKKEKDSIQKEVQRAEPILDADDLADIEF